MAAVGVLGGPLRYAASAQDREAPRFVRGCSNQNTLKRLHVLPVAVLKPLQLSSSAMASGAVPPRASLTASVRASRGPCPTTALRAGAARSASSAFSVNRLTDVPDAFAVCRRSLSNPASRETVNFLGLLPCLLGITDRLFTPLPSEPLPTQSVRPTSRPARKERHGQQAPWQWSRREPRSPSAG
jgi:hypothetical protein